MDRNLNLFMGQPEILHSQAAEAGARHLLEKADKGELKIEILPNNFSQFTGEAEERDYVSYCHFLKTMEGRKIIRMLEESDAEEFIEL